MKDAITIEEEYQVENQLIQEELKRLGEQKKVLEDMIEYIHVRNCQVHF